MAVSGKNFSFTEDTLAKIFGHEAAENENPDRLREYYFKTVTFDQVVNDLPLRILVGHKGIGKSALFQVALQEEKEKRRLAILIKPDDIIELGSKKDDFLQEIRDWKLGINQIIISKILGGFGLLYDGWREKLNQYGGMLLNFLQDTFDKQQKIDLSPSKELLVKEFLKNNKISVYIDDLDRGWEGRREDIRRISALLNAVRDISTDNSGV